MPNKFQENILLADYSHYKIGGPARYFFNAKTEKDLVWAIREAKKKKLPVFVLGGGTNLLMSDKGFNGLVIRSDIKTLKATGNSLKVGAGVVMADLLDFSAKKSLKGLEWAGGLPGTLGGAVRGNAGCFGGEIKDTVVSVRSLDTKAMKIVNRKNKDCKFAYRSSIFKQKNGNEIVLEATLRLSKGKKSEILASMKEKIAHRVKNHPLEHPNIGSIFKNIPLDAIHAKGTKEYAAALASAKLIFVGSDFSVKMDPFPVISAAKLISESGLRGVSFGGAMISPKHPNFIVNVLGARAEDVEALIALAKAEVGKRFGVELEEEVQIV
jgi:UDP-N-acetylmuramate dehydrogenase